MRLPAVFGKIRFPVRELKQNTRRDNGELSKDDKSSHRR